MCLGFMHMLLFVKECTFNLFTIYISLLTVVVLDIIADGGNNILQNFDTYIPVYW